MLCRHWRGFKLVFTQVWIFILEQSIPYSKSLCSKLTKENVKSGFKIRGHVNRKHLIFQVKCPLYVVHVMSKTSADVISKGRHSGNVIFGEPIAASLASNGSHYYHPCWRHAAGFVLSPPLREDLTTPDYLMQMLASGELQCKLKAIHK